MPDISCKICGRPISDPCVKFSGLMTMKSDVMQQLKESPEDIAAKNELLHIDTLISQHIGLNNGDIHFNQYIKNKNLNSFPAFNQITFTLKCPVGHREQYQISCKS